MRYTISLIALALVAAQSGLNGRALDWGSSLFGNNVLEDKSTALDGAFVFYLGTFNSGFTPNSENFYEWADNWTTVDAVNYNPDYQVFNARHILASGDPAVGTKGYIWGIRRNKDLNEWILISDPAWTWPQNSLLGLKVSWTVGEASEAVIGEVNNGSNQMVTLNVGDAPLPSIDYAIWAKRFFVDGDPNASEGADPDGNGRSNMIDFALDDNPVLPGSGSPMESGIFEIVEGPSAQESGGDRYLAVILRPSIDADVTFTGTLASEPTFTQNVQAAVVEDLGDGTLLIRDTEPVGSLDSGKFLRVNVN